MKTVSLLIAISLISACSGDSSSPETEQSTLRVLINGSNVTCGSGVGFGIDNSMQNLINEGIDVITSQCGIAMNNEGNLSCDPFDTIYTHEIRPENLQDAQELGYISEEQLQDNFDLSLTLVENCL